MVRKASATSSASSRRILNAKLASFKRSKKRTQRAHVSKGAIRRLARRGGVGRISALIYPETREVLKAYLRSLVRDSIMFCEYFKRKTIMSEDVVRALRSRGQRLYGFDDKPFPLTMRYSARLVDDSSRNQMGSGDSPSVCTRASSRFINSTG